MNAAATDRSPAKAGDAALLAGGRWLDLPTVGFGPLTTQIFANSAAAVTKSSRPRATSCATPVLSRPMAWAASF